MNRFETAVVVPAHAALRADVDVSEVSDIFMEPTSWILLDYQQNGGYGARGEQTLFMEHLGSGLQAAAENPASVLILSGGHTRAEAGQENRGWSEAASYYASARGLVHKLGLADTDVLDRTLVGEHARDSYENVEEGSELFQAVMGYPPQWIEVHGFGFKERRYQRHHAEIFRGVEPTSVPHLVYVSVNNPVGAADLAAAMRGEEKALQDFEEHPRGDGGTLLDKRRARTFQGRRSPYPQEVTIARFLEHHGNPPTPRPVPSRALVAAGR